MHKTAVSRLPARVHGVKGAARSLRDDLRPDPERVREPTGGYSREQRLAARKLAAETLRRLRDGEIRVEPTADPAALRAMMEFALGEPFSDRYFSLLREELALPGEDLRAPGWRKDDIDPDRPFRVAVVGAGMSGLAAAHRLRQAGVEVVVFEKNDDVGGTWLENDYPGCRVDIQNHFYSYATAQTPDWPQYHSPQPVLLEYFRTCIERFGVAERRFARSPRLDIRILQRRIDHAQRGDLAVFLRLHGVLELRRPGVLPVLVPAVEILRTVTAAGAGAAGHRGWGRGRRRPGAGAVRSFVI